MLTSSDGENDGWVFITVVDGNNNFLPSAMLLVAYDKMIGMGKRKFWKRLNHCEQVMRTTGDTFDGKGITMKVAIGGDHAGFELKQRLKECFNWQWIDVGSTRNESCDYPDFAHALCHAVEANEAEWGILICGSANGMAMAANKHEGIRCAICWNQELAALAKAHNNANVLALPARFITSDLAETIVKVFASSSFEGGRHLRRVDKIAC